jgi:DNA-binding YbaB/EbfC family protein
VTDASNPDVPDDDEDDSFLAGYSGEVVHPEVVGDSKLDETDDGDPFAMLGGGGAAGLDLGALLESATQMQQQMAQAQQEAAAKIVEGASGGGMVKIEAKGDGTFTSVTINADVVDPSDIEMLQDLVLAALHDVTEELQALQQQSLGGLDLGGLGGLGGMLGGS